MTIQRLRCEWGGTAVEGPGLTTFYAEADGTLAIQVGAGGFFDAVKFMIPVGTTITIPQGGDEIDEATGALVGTWGTSSLTTITGTGTGSFAQGVGARVVWQTGGIVGGRRVRGSTFVCPIVVTQFESNGTLANTALQGLNAGITAMMAQVPTQMRIWSRPVAGRAGTVSTVTAGNAPDKVSWLRSRRV